MVVHCATHKLMRLHYEAGFLPQNADILDIGQVEWGYSADDLVKDIHRFSHGQERENFINRLIVAAKNNDVFEVGKIYYNLFFKNKTHEIIDLHGTKDAMKLNLNNKISTGKEYSVIINNGTAEHIFNIGQVFETIHNHAAPGALMIHEIPFLGCINHGFYNINPTFIFDLSASNNYQIISAHACSCEHSDILRINNAKDGEKCEWKNSLLVFYLMQSNKKKEFVYPQQGVYK